MGLNRRSSLWLKRILSHFESQGGLFRMHCQTYCSGSFSILSFHSVNLFTVTPVGIYTRSVEINSQFSLPSKEVCRLVFLLTEEHKPTRSQRRLLPFDTDGEGDGATVKQKSYNRQ